MSVFEIIKNHSASFRKEQLLGAIQSGQFEEHFGLDSINWKIRGLSVSVLFIPVEHKPNTYNIVTNTNDADSHRLFSFMCWKVIAMLEYQYEYAYRPSELDPLIEFVNREHLNEYGSILNSVIARSPIIKSIRQFANTTPFAVGDIRIVEEDKKITVSLHDGAYSEEKENTLKSLFKTYVENILSVYYPEYEAEAEGRLYSIKEKDSAP